MDERRFDRLIRALGGGVSRRGALSALAGMAAGLGLGLDGRESDAKRRRKKCNPACPAGQTCKQGTCSCDNGGAVCGASCCRGGERCEGGRCVTEPAQCIAAGERCKDTGRPCCDGTVCASGQGGKGDIACYVPAGGACATTAECVYDATCKAGTCVANPQPTPAPRCTVCAAGCPYTTIEAAIAAASPGDVITIAAGNYAPVPTKNSYQNTYLTVDKSLTLKVYEPGGRVTIACPYVSTTPADIANCIVALPPADRVVLEGLTLDTSFSGSNVAIGVICASSCAITDCRITNVSRGVYVSPIGNVSINGLHIDSVQTLSSDFGLGKAGQATGGVISCSAPVTYTTDPVSPALKCGTVAEGTQFIFAGCGC